MQCFLLGKKRNLCLVPCHASHVSNMHVIRGVYVARYVSDAVCASSNFLSCVMSSSPRYHVVRYVVRGTLNVVPSMSCDHLIWRVREKNVAQNFLLSRQHVVTYVVRCAYLCRAIKKHVVTYVVRCAYLCRAIKKHVVRYGVGSHHHVVQMRLLSMYKCGTHPITMSCDMIRYQVILHGTLFEHMHMCTA